MHLRRINCIGATILIFTCYLISGYFYQLNGQVKKNGLFFVDPEMRSASISFELINNLIIIPLQINDSDSLFFILDSGVKNTIITELSSDDSITIKYARKTTLKGLGDDNKYIEAYQSDHNSLSLLNGNNNILGNDIDLFVLIDSTFHFSKYFGRKINGIVGADILKNFIVQIDYIQKRIKFYNPDSYSYKRNTKVFPLKIFNSKPYMNCLIIQNNGKEIEANMLLDTGASLSIWLQKESNPLIVLPEKTINTRLGYGLGGEISGKIGRINKLNIAGSIINYPIVSYPDSGLYSKQSAYLERNGTIGADVLRRFKIIFDYQGNKISLRPNKHFKQEFNYNLSGMQITAPYPDFPIFLIEQIIPGSLSDISGLRIDDQIYKLNSKLAVQYSLSEINAILSQPPGRTIRITVLRNGNKHHFKIKLISEI